MGKRGPKPGPKDPEIRRLLYAEALGIEGWFRPSHPSLIHLSSPTTITGFLNQLVEDGEMERAGVLYKWIND